MSADLSGRRVLVVGATRGLGRGIAAALAKAGADVSGIGRDADAVRGLEGDSIHGICGDATQSGFLGKILSRVEPNVVIQAAGASPLLRPLSQYSWEALSEPWHTDVKLTFEVLREGLHGSLGKGGQVVVFSSGAAKNPGGSPLSGGYAGAKQTQRFLCRYAAQEAREREVDLKVQCILPQLNPNTDLGRAAIKAYAHQAGVDEAAFVKKRFGDQPLSPAVAGRALCELLSGSEADSPELMLSGQGLTPL